MPGMHATGTLGITASSEFDRDVAGVQGTYGWSVQSGAVTFSSGLTFAVAAIAAGDYTVNSVAGAVYAGGNVTLTTQDPTSPRVDRIVITSAGAVSALPGTPAALTSTSGPTPPAITSAQLEIARIFVPASGTALTAACITDRRHPLAAAAATKKYKSATQVFTTNTTYADVTASSGSFAFPIAASEVWLAEFWMLVSAGGTGGVKFQLTGPGTPTAVNAVALASNANIDASAGVAAIPPIGTTSYISGVLAATAFSATIIGVNSASTSTDNTINGGVSLPIRITALIANGANAGTVTLQAAQNSSNSTTTLGIGSYMRAERVA